VVVRVIVAPLITPHPKETLCEARGLARLRRVNDYSLTTEGLNPSVMRGPSVLQVAGEFIEVGESKLAIHRAFAATVVAVLATSVLVAASPAMAGGVKSPDKPTATQSEDYPLSPEVFNGAVKLRAEGPTLFPDTFGGIASGIEGDQDVLVVYLTQVNDDVEKQIIDLLAIEPAKIRFEKAALTAGQAAAVDERVTADVESGKLDGVVRWGITRDVHVEIAFGADSPDVSRRGLDYGPGVVMITGEESESTAANRFSDSSPWNAGNFITAGGGGCTSAFPMKWNVNGNKYVLTAGHCFSVAQNVYNYAASPINSGSNALIGSVTNQSFGNNQLDAELIAADGSRNIWTGGITPSGTLAVEAFLDPWDGVPLCISGAYDGQTCGLTASEVNMNSSINYGGGAWTVPNTSRITMSNKLFLGQGDSGAPIYANLSGVTYGFGIFIAVATSGAVACNNWSTQFGASRKCNNNGRMTNIGPILNKWNLSLD
jgi:hypothetical protein